MGFRIEDGTGSGFTTKVDDTNRLLTRSVVDTTLIEATMRGEAFLITSGNINLTSANESAIVLFKNDSDFDVIINETFARVQTSTGGSNPHVELTAHRNPVSMTSGAGDAYIFNMNFGSSAVLSSTTYRGAEGAAMGTSNPMATWTAETGKTSNLLATVVLPKGSSIGFTATPPANNTSLDLGVAFFGHQIKFNR